MKRFVIVIGFILTGVGLAEDALVREYKDAEAAVSRLKSQVYACSTENAALKRELRELAILRDILTGQRTGSPKVSVSTNLVRVIVGDEPWNCVCAGEGNMNRVEWLKVPDERTYLIEAEVKAEDMKGPVKFGGYVPIRGASVQWPGVRLGGGTFDWSKVSFAYRLPWGGQLSVCFGPNSNAGSVWFRNVKVFELQERE